MAKKATQTEKYLFGTREVVVTTKGKDVIVKTGGNIIFNSDKSEKTFDEFWNELIITSRCSNIVKL